MSKVAPVDDHAVRVHPRAQGSFLDGMLHAIHGVLHVIKHERNARVHLWFAVAAALLGVLLHLSDDELAAVFFAVIIVFLSEMFNTAIERTLDLIDLEENPRIKIIKDMSAGAVLVAAVAALFIGLVIFVPHIWRTLWGT
ncbi:MAG TPA: diacylglycerol kinase family protein [Candidatus Saccharimonadia bacterium]